MISKVPTTRERYFSLVEAIGMKHKAGNKEATADLELLETLIEPAFGFQQNAKIRIRHAIIKGIEQGEQRDSRIQRLELEQRQLEDASAVARERVNELSRKYGVEDVFLPDTSSSLLSAELISQYLSEL